MGIFTKIFKKKTKKSAAAGDAPESQDPQDPEIVSKLVPKKGRERVAAQKLEIDSNFKPPEYEKDESTSAFIYDVISESFVFTGVDHKGKEVLVKAMQAHVADAGEEIISQGDIGDFFYILEKGKVTFEVDEKEVGTAENRAVFGELALLYDTPRAATVKASCQCKLWKIDQKTFRFIMISSTRGDDEKIYSTLRTVKLFDKMQPDFFVKLSTAMVLKEVNPGETIIKKGDVGDTFYVIKSGTVKVTDIGLDSSAKFDDHELHEGGCFGERALLTGDVRAANITAVSPCTLLCLDRKDFEETIGQLQDLIKLAGIRSMINGIPAVTKKSTEAHHLESLVSAVKKTDYKAGMTIENACNKGYYFIYSGKAITTDMEGKSEVITSGYFGSLDDSSSISVKFEDDTECGFLSAASINRVLAGVSEASSAKSSKKLSLKLNDLKLHKMLGQGSFGKVFLVTINGDQAQTPYALKMMSKKQLIVSKQVNNVISEKIVMESFDHPFLIKLAATFQDDYSVFMVLGLAQGGELYQYIQKQPRYRLDKDSVQFYTACTLEGLHHLHSRKVCHRDIKPENILIGNDGYCIIIDMGFAKVVEDKTFTLCGTPVYLAPEILVMKGHNKGVDYWALGVLIFESLVGHEPFYADDQTAMFKKICKLNFTCPETMDADAKDLVEKLLVGLKRRLGCLANGADDIRNHPFYASINWEELVNKKVKAPWVPNVKDSLDTSNFNAMKYKPERKVKLSQAEDALFDGF